MVNMKKKKKNKKNREKKKTKNNQSAAINDSIASNETERQGFVKGSVRETNAEGSTKEAENKEVSEKISVLEQQNLCLWDKDMVFDESFLQRVKPGYDSTVLFKSEDERKFELKIGEMDLKINDSFEPSADGMGTHKLAKIEDLLEDFNPFKMNIKKGASNISFNNAEGAVSCVKSVFEEMKKGMLLSNEGEKHTSFEESEWEKDAAGRKERWETNVEGSRKEAENKEISEKVSAMEEQIRCIREKDVAFDESSLQGVKHVKKIIDSTVSFEDESEVEKNFELKIDEMDLKINDSFKPSADDLEKNAEGSRKEVENKEISEKVSALEEENWCIENKDGVFEEIFLQGVKHANKINDLTVSFENKSEVEKNFELKIGEMDLKTNDSFKPSADDLEKNAGGSRKEVENKEISEKVSALEEENRCIEEKDGAFEEIFLEGKANDSTALLEDNEKKNGRLGEDLEKDMSEVEKGFEVKINDASKPFVDDPEKNEDLAEDFSQFETKIKDRRSELAFEAKEEIHPCTDTGMQNLLEVLVPASENRTCIEEKDGAFTENFIEDTIKTLARIGDLGEKFVQLEKKMIEIERCCELKIQYTCNAIWVPLSSEQQTIRQMLKSQEAKIWTSERKIFDITNQIANATKEQEKKFELMIGKLNSQINDHKNSFVRELESMKLSLKKRDAKIKNEKVEMEKNFDLNAAQLNLKIYEELNPFVDDLEIMKMEMKEKETNIEELKGALETLQCSFVESQKSRGRVWKFIVPTITTIVAAATGCFIYYYAARTGKSTFRSHTEKYALP